MSHLVHRTTGGRVITATFSLKGARSRVGVIVVDNEAKRNALCGQCMDQLGAGIASLRSDPKVASVLVCGARGRFCAGAEMPTLMEGGFQTHMHDALSQMRTAGYVTYALIEGHAIGGGAELAMSCDVRLWTPKASLQYVQTGMGITTGWGGASYAAASLPRASAVHLLCSGERVSSFDAAVRYGVSQQQVSSDAFSESDLPDSASFVRLQEAECSEALEVMSPLAQQSAAYLLGLYGGRFPSAVRAMKGISGSPNPLLSERSDFTSLWGAADHKEALSTWKILANKKTKGGPDDKAGSA